MKDSVSMLQHSTAWYSMLQPLCKFRLAPAKVYYMTSCINVYHTPTGAPRSAQASTDRSRSRHAKEPEIRRNNRFPILSSRFPMVPKSLPDFENFASPDPISDPQEISRNHVKSLLLLSQLSPQSTFNPYDINPPDFATPYLVHISSSLIILITFHHFPTTSPPLQLCGATAMMIQV